MNSDPHGKGETIESEASSPDSDDVPYRYTDSGIQERHGHVPVWLWAVVVIVLAWGVYYVITFWSPTS